MEESLREYIRSLIPQGFPDGRELLREGVEIGKAIQVPRTAFLESMAAKAIWNTEKSVLQKGK